MKRSAIVILFLIAAPALHAQQTKSPQIIHLFREVVAKPSQSTVRVKVDGENAALGTVVSADGWILTKHSEIKDGKITCTLPGGEEVAAKLVGFDEPFDLAMLKVDAKDLTPVVWTDSKVSRVGHWVASPGTGQDPVAIGILSVAARKIKGTKFIAPTGKAGGYVGIFFDVNFAGVKIEELVPNQAAAKAGLKVGDQIIAFNSVMIENIDDLRGLLSKTKPGDDATFKIIRDKKQMEIQAALGRNPSDRNGKSRSDTQNNMGSKLSARRAGFPVILQHDSVLRPTDCGGPLVNLEGQVLGINIARAGRTESYAIPSEAVRPLLEKLKMPKKE